MRLVGATYEADPATGLPQRGYLEPVPEAAMLSLGSAQPAAHPMLCWAAILLAKMMRRVTKEDNQGDHVCIDLDELPVPDSNSLIRMTEKAKNDADDMSLQEGREGAPAPPAGLRQRDQRAPGHRDSHPVQSLCVRLQPRPGTSLKPEVEPVLTFFSLTCMPDMT